MYTEVLILVVLVILNAFFAASEIALISLNDNKVKMLAKEGNKKYMLLNSLLSEPSKFLATIQIGITLAGFLASAFAAESFAKPVVLFFQGLNLPVSEPLLKSASVIIITVVLSYFTLVFGELVPKRVAMRKAEFISGVVARPLSLLMKITYPFVKFLTFSTNICVRIFGINPNEKEDNVTEEEIRMMVDVGEETGAIHETEKVMINNIFDFNNKSVLNAMTHRTEIAALPVDAEFEEVMEFLKKEKYSRIPVYEETIDNIVGILYLKDVLCYLDEIGNIAEFRLKDVMKKAYHIPFSVKMDELFREFQKNNIHMAIVIDEYGGTAGLVSMEDLLEEIVGKIFDEYDEIEKNIEKIDENNFIADGLTTLAELKTAVDIELPSEEQDTLSGFIVGMLGKIPTRNENPTVNYANYSFTVLESDDKKISKVKIVKHEEIIEEEREE